MKLNDYNDFYNEVICKCIDGVFRLASEYGLDEKCIKKRTDLQNRIFKNYQMKRDYIRSNYMSKRADVSLDRHKVASCMIYAILKTKPLKINRLVWNLPEEILLANEYLAFFVALNIIEMYRLDKMREENIIGKFQIIVPKTYHEDLEPENTYESNFCKSLYYLSMEDVNKFDVFAYADILFLLEKYTDVYLEEDRQHENAHI